MKKDFQDEFMSVLIDALADASKNCQEKGPVVFNGQRPHEADYGISPLNPLCSTSLGGTDAYLQRLRTLDGKKFTWSRGETIYVDCNGAKEVGMDKYQLYLEGKPYKVLYFVPYVGESTDAPHGMHLIGSPTIEPSTPSALHMEPSPQNTAPEASAVRQRVKVKVKTKSIPGSPLPTAPPLQPAAEPQSDGTNGLVVSAELQIEDSGEEVVETQKVDPIHKETDVVVPVSDSANQVTENAPQQPRIDEKNSPKPSRKKWKLILFSAIGVILVAVLVMLIVHHLPEKVNRLDINAIYGCPELYNIEFGMDVDTVDSLIEVEHSTVKPHPTSDDQPMITLKYDTEFNLYNLPIQDFLCSFDDQLEMVLFFFEKESVMYEQLTELYTKIYGQATSSDATKTVWSGAKTTITIFADSEDDVYVVRYAETPNLRFTALSFDGAEIDPCGFLSDHYVFDKTASHYTAGLQKDKDYSMKHYSADGFAAFSKYTFFPSFEYMGVDAGYTAISLDIDDSEKTVGVVSYLFYLNQQNAVDRIDYIKNALDRAYGQFVNCTYTSTYYSDMGVTDITFSEARSKIRAGTQGMYYMHWEADGYNITLGLTIKTNASYYDGSVSFAIQGSHKHEYTLKTEIAPTCEKDGKKEYVCDCGDGYTKTINATGHAYTGESCTETAVCSNCGKTGTALGHNLVQCVCTKCHSIVLTEEDLQGTWISTWSTPGAYRKITISGSSYRLEYYCQDVEYGYTDLNIYAGTFSVSGNVITIRATATNTRTTASGTETKTFAYNVEEIVVEYTPGMFKFDGLFPFYKQ